MDKLNLTFRYTSDNAHNGKLYVYVYDVTGFGATDNEILHGPLLDFNGLPDPQSPDTLGEQLNELKPFANRDWRYLVSYMWVLDDGRVIQDAKIIRRAEMPFDVGLNLYKNELLSANLYASGGYLYTGIGTTANPVLTDFSAFTTAAVEAAHSAGEAQFKEHAQTAWQLKNTTDSMKSITLTIKISDTESYSKKVDNPVDGSSFEVPVTRYRIVYRDGAYYTIPEVVNRIYTLRHDAASDTWYLNFDKTDDASQKGYLLNDVETNIVVDVVVNSTLGDLTVSKTVTGDRAPTDDSFTFSVNFSDGGTYSGIPDGGSFALKDGESKTFSGIPEGVNWTVTETYNPKYTAEQSSFTGDMTTAGANANFVNTYSSGIVQTGDNSRLPLYMGIMAAAVIILLVTMILIRKHKDK